MPLSSSGLGLQVFILATAVQFCLGVHFKEGVNMAEKSCSNCNHKKVCVHAGTFEKTFKNMFMVNMEQEKWDIFRKYVGELCLDHDFIKGTNGG